MVSFTSVAINSAALAAIYISGVASAPTASSSYTPSKVASGTGATHTVVAGLGGLHFDPENVVAEIGDIVEFHYLAANHSVVQSSFAQPCVPQAGGGFFSGFMPTPAGQQNPNVFTIDVTDKKPIWFYCSQTKGDHCQMGMAGVINQDFNGPNTLSAYKAAAALQLGKQQSISPPFVGGGIVKPNPNPLGGF
jgi:plastocyanin